MALLVDELGVRRGPRLVLSGFTLKVSEGEAVVLHGPNGAGKTTLLRTIAGFLPIAAGQIVYHDAGHDTGTEPSEFLHYVGHQNGLKASLTVADNLRFWARFYGCRDDNVDHALETFELDGLVDIPTAYLSAGQKRRAGLARLVISERPIWLLDEPTVSLDLEMTKLLAGVIDAHTEKGGIVLAATHLPLGIKNSRIQELRPIVEPASTEEFPVTVEHDYDDWARS